MVEIGTATFASEAALPLPSREAALDHVVPCRVLVDRMIMDPSHCGPLLMAGVVLAKITKAEHRQLGGIFTHHAAVYELMLSAPVTDLPGFGHDRYRAAGIELASIA